jgi:hypothetical protein
MRISRLLSPIQRIIADPRLRWAHDPQLWVEMFVTVTRFFALGVSELFEDLIDRELQFCTSPLQRVVRLRA